MTNNLIDEAQNNNTILGKKFWKLPKCYIVFIRHCIINSHSINLESKKGSDKILSRNWFAVNVFKISYSRTKYRARSLTL